MNELNSIKREMSNKAETKDIEILFKRVGGTVSMKDFNIFEEKFTALR
jgi:hypothetical protein